MSKITYSTSSVGTRVRGTPVFVCEGCKKKYQTKAQAMNHKCEVE